MMQLKLIESGGFLGKTKSSVLDLLTLSEDLRETIENFVKVSEDNTPENRPGRDAFAYFWVLEKDQTEFVKKIYGNQLPDALQVVFDQMKEQLKYP